MIDFKEQCPLLVDRLGCTNDCYIEVEQKKGPAPRPQDKTTPQEQ